MRGWIAKKCCDHKPYEWVETIYNFRAELRPISVTLGIPLKLAINSLYGKFAQSIGAAPYRDYLSAGLITAYTRAKLIEAIGTLPPWERDEVLMLATDGIYTMTPLPKLKIGSALGEWPAPQMKASASFTMASCNCPAVTTAGRMMTMTARRRAFG
jgi:hypothetical protein